MRQPFLEDARTPVHCVPLFKRAASGMHVVMTVDRHFFLAIFLLTKLLDGISRFGIQKHAKVTRQRKSRQTLRIAELRARCARSGVARKHQHQGHMLVEPGRSEALDGDMEAVSKAPIDIAADPRNSNNLERPFAALSNNVSRSVAVQRAVIVLGAFLSLSTDWAVFPSCFVDSHLVAKSSWGGLSRMSSSWLASHRTLHNNESRTWDENFQHGNLTVTELDEKKKREHDRDNNESRTSARRWTFLVTGFLSSTVDGHSSSVGVTTRKSHVMVKARNYSAHKT